MMIKLNGIDWRQYNPEKDILYWKKNFNIRF